MKAAPANHVGAFGSSLYICLIYCLITLGFGALAVVVVFPLNYVVLLIWAAVVWTGARRLQKTQSASGLITAQMAFMAAILTAAILAPIKTTKRYLDHTLQVPRLQMSLAEFAGEPNGLKPEWLPRWISVQVPDDEPPVKVRFDHSPLTVREFVGALESQTSLRHRFGHCGNGSTILWGGDCSFGMILRRPPSRYDGG